MAEKETIMTKELNAVAERLYKDLCFAAPEMWPMKIRDAIEDAASIGKADQPPKLCGAYVADGNGALGWNCDLVAGHSGECAGTSCYAR